MKYQSIVQAKFISRPNRFIARVEIDGRVESAHVKNTGRCRELLVPGCTVYLEDFSGRMGSRKMKYSLVAVIKESPRGSLLINMDSQAPNIVVREALKDGTICIPALGELEIIRPESTYGNSRFDFYLEGSKGRGFLEVKGCTLEENNIASFPDAPTERGVRHIEELIDAKKNGYYAGILFVIQMEGMKCICPNDKTHPAFGDALRRAAACGVDALAYECTVTEDTLTITKKNAVAMNKIQRQLFELQDMEYARFQSKLTPTVDPQLFIGVRVPECRALAKKLYKNDADAVEEFFTDLPHKYYDENMLHGLLISGISDFDQCMTELEAFLPYVDNWAVCDIMSPKCLKKRRPELLAAIKRWTESPEEYTVRFGLEMLMTHFLDDDFDPEYLKIAAHVHSDKYYVNMMAAWFFATALAKQWDSAVRYIEECTLDEWVHNKTIQKARESYRITDEQKQYLKKLKR